MPAKSRQQFKYIWAMRNKYKTKSKAPKNMKWVFKKEWTSGVPFHDLPTKTMKKKRKTKRKYEHVTTNFSDFLVPTKINSPDMNPLSKAWKKLFSHKTPKEKIDSIVSRIDKSWQALLKESEGTEGLKVGKILGYENFGNFAEACLDFTEAVQTAIIHDTEHQTHYQRLIEKVASRMSHIKHIRQVSSLSVSQFKKARISIKELL